MTEEEKKNFKHIKERAEYVSENILGTNVFTTYDVYCVNMLIEIIQKQNTEINKLNKRISDLEFALIDMVYQFADESKNQLNTMGLSALETAFCELDFDDPIDKDIVRKKFEELYIKYINNK